ncbi:MAG: (5-formylfuran-3-yl)methyl phosphate synthase [Roseiarcus sp.]
MTRFLASVANADEARIVCAQGADIIDAKDPTTGALGALKLDAVRAIVAAVAGKTPVSAVAGDLPMEPEVIFAAVKALASIGVSYVKIGLFPGAKREACIRALVPAAASVKLIGVMFADDGFDAALIPVMAQAGFAGAMIDTANKGDKRLLDHMDPSSLIGFVDSCHAHGLLVGLAGSLELPDIPRLLLLSPDLLGFRGALCGTGGRSGRIDPQAVGKVRELIPGERRGAPGAAMASKADYRLLAAQCFSADPRKNSDATDCIFVHDFVLPVRIGAYARERKKPQRVRFNVDVDLKRLDHVPEDMRDVVSYDVLTDGIAMIVAVEHIALVEMLAERVAALALAYPRVARVTVRVEKLDIRPGSVGVEITRERAVEASGAHQLFLGPVGRSEPKRAS